MNSADLFKRACDVIPGGVNSPVRAFKAVGGDPVYVQSGKGTSITTVEGNVLTDFCGSWGPLILGHAHPAIVAAVCEAAGQGTTFGINTPREVEFAELMCDLVPSMDMVRLVSSGTEATMTALRIARGVTGRQKIIKFDGCYHGHADYLLVSAGSGLLTGGISSSAGVSHAAAAEVLVLPYNDTGALQNVMHEAGKEVAAIIVEPLAGNMGLVPPADGFLQSLRTLADESGALLIFDEVISGFRLGPTTYGELCGVRPDLTCLGKIVGGGMPLGAVGGRRACMESLAPLGDVYQAGTLSGNPVAVAAGTAMLRQLVANPPYAGLEQLAAKLAGGLNAIAAERGLILHAAQMGAMFTPFFTQGPVRNLNDAKSCDTEMYAKFFRGMLGAGFYLPPSQFEVAFLSAAHTEADVDRFLSAATRVLGE